MERHDLLHEFPEYQEKIDQLKEADTHFRELFDEYHKKTNENQLVCIILQDPILLSVRLLP